MPEAIHVLQIDGSPETVQQTASMLADATSARFMLESTGTLADGIRRLAKGGIDAVLLELKLPDGTGLDTFRILHTTTGARIPVIIYTCTDDEELSLLALRFGAADYLVKGDVGTKLLARSINFALSRNGFAANSNKAVLPEKAATPQVISVEKSSVSAGKFSVTFNDKRLVSVVAMEATKERLLKLVRRSDCDEVRIDLSKVEYVANTAISILLTVNKQAKKLGKTFVLSGVSPQVFEQFSGRRFDRVLNIERAGT